MAVTLYQIAPSFYSQIARLALVEKGVSWVEHQVNIGPMMENFEPWFMRLHPSGVVPVLDHDGKIVIEALQIIEFVDREFGGPSLTPTDFKKRARMNAWLQRLNAFKMREFSYGLMLAKPIGVLAAHTFDLRRKTLKRHIGKNPEFAELYRARLEDIDAWQKISTNPVEVDKLQQEVREILDELELELSHGQPWLLGSQYSLADIWTTVFLSRLKQLWAGKDGGGPGGAFPPGVGAYFNRLKSRPSYQTADIWEKFRVGFILRLVAPFLVPRLLAALAVVVGAGIGIWWVVTQLMISA